MLYLVYTGWVFYLFIFLLGLAMGSFLNSWVWRTRENIRIVRGRSMCPQCRRQLRWFENIPVLSNLFLGGKCRTCKNRIPRHFNYVELGTALVFLFTAWFHVNSFVFTPAHFVRDIIFIILLIVIFVFDMLYQVVLSDIVWFGSIAGFFINLFYLDYDLQDLLIGAVAVSGFFLLQYAVSKGKWIGGGDVRLGFMIGVWLGWPVALVALGAAYALGAIYGIILVLTGRKKLSSAVPFGTYLSVGTFIAMFWGGQIVNWYLKFLT